MSDKDIQQQNTALAAKEEAELEKFGARVPAAGHFEYKVVPVSDFMDGGANVSKIEELLNLYGEMGWRLSQTVVNEVGPSRFHSSNGTIPTTQEQTLLILERWVPGA
ncbi:MAG: DUF4177 domain-containing protein [Coriobacteriales bacterium]